MNYQKTFNRITLIAWSTIAVIFFMCSMTLNDAQAKFLFYTRIDYYAGGDPSFVAIGDLDLAVANRWSGTVSVLLGNGDGSFQSAVNYGAGAKPWSVAIGDLNGDANLDLAIADTRSNSVSILFNIGAAIVNDFVTFDPDPSTYAFTPDTSNCPTGFAGKFSFDATLTNISEKELSNLNVEVDELANNNLLLTDHGLIGEGERFEVKNSDDYVDGILRHEEFVDVSFTLCLKEKKPFRFFVNVVGVATD